MHQINHYHLLTAIKEATETGNLHPRNKSNSDVDNII